MTPFCAGFGKRQSRNPLAVPFVTWVSMTGHGANAKITEPLVNLDLHRVVDLLPDRAAESFSEWLKQHPEIVTISRDRCGIYAEGAALGAPQSQQIADRFRLVLNLSATMERVLEERSRQLILPPLQDSAVES